MALTIGQIAARIHKDMCEEEWRPVSGYEGVYEVSNLGNIRSLDRYTSAGYGSKKLTKGKELKPMLDSRGNYLYVYLRNCGKDRRVAVHRVVASAFHENPLNKKYVDHINGDKKDNRSENLRWATPKENVAYAVELGAVNPKDRAEQLRSPEMRKKQRDSRRSPVLRSDGVVFDSLAEAARALGCSKSLVSHVLRGRVKTCRGFTFSYIQGA